MLAETIIRIAVFLLGFLIVLRTVLAAIRFFLLPRSARDRIAAVFFVTWRKLFYWRTSRATTYEERDRIMAMFAPVSLLALPAFLLSLILVGYVLMYWAYGVEPLYNAFALSGSSLLTLGFARHEGTVLLLLTFSEAGMGITLAALLVSYLPTMYAAFSARETAVTLLEVRAGSPPSAGEMLIRTHQIHGLEYLSEVWEPWEIWFAALEESHTSLAALVFFRSPKPQRSWITAAGAVLDCAALSASTLDLPPNPEAQLCLRAGYLALRSIADFYLIPHNPNPTPDDPISVTRAEFDDAYEHLRAEGVPLRPDRDQCWRDFTGWRVNYDVVLIKLAAMTMAPYAPWISDRELPRSPQSMKAKRP